MVDYLSKLDVLFTGDEMDEIIVAIGTGMLPKSWTRRREHVAGLKDRFASTAVCAKCGAPLVLRTAKSGRSAGTQFYGCSKYPACRYVKKLDPTS